MKTRSYVKADRLCAEVLRRAAETGEPISDSDVLNCLRKIPFSENRLRKNVIADGVPHVYSQCAGLTTARRSQGLGPVKSKVAGKCPNLVKVLAEFCRQAELKQFGSESVDGGAASQPAASQVQPHACDTSGLAFTPKRFAFTSITLNYNYAAKPHVDSSHVDGLARIIALGDFTGGELVVKGLGTRDVRNKWVDFDGRCLHHVQVGAACCVWTACEQQPSPEPSKVPSKGHRSISTRKVRR
jgi:hypothetical protein